MAVAVLDRKIDTENKWGVATDYREGYMSADEKHNLQISSNYAKLINPEYSLKDILSKETPSVYAVQNVEPQEVAINEEKQSEVLYQVENARADSEIFRADSAVNKKIVESAVENVEADEDEDEDLRPTQTTIQYKTAGVKKAEEEGKIATKPSVKKAGLTKKDKIIIAVAFTVIIALFVLIIVNSAVISGLNREISSLNNTLSEVENTYVEVLTEKEEYLDEDNLYNVVNNFAAQNGMILK